MSEDEAEDLYEMANLYPKHTGLPMEIWVSERGRVLAGDLTPADRDKVLHWIALNESALIDYWDHTIDTLELIQRLNALSPI